jgi:hypothetical protein
MMRPKATTKKWEFQPLRSCAASAIPDRSAPTLIVLAPASAMTKAMQTQRGIFWRSPLASPSPVTIPMRAHIICTAAMRGQVTSDVQRSRVPNWAPVIE